MILKDTFSDENSIDFSKKTLLHTHTDTHTHRHTYTHMTVIQINKYTLQ